MSPETYPAEAAGLRSWAPWTATAEQLEDTNAGRLVRVAFGRGASTSPCHPSSDRLRNAVRVSFSDKEHLAKCTFKLFNKLVCSPLKK